MANVKFLLLIVCLSIAGAGAAEPAEAATLRMPVVMRNETRMVATNAYFLVNGNIVDAPLETWNARTPVEKALADFLKLASGPNSDRAVSSIAQPPSGPSGDESLPPAALLQLYQGLLKMPARRVLFSIDFSDRTLFFWKTAQADGSMPRVAASLVRSQAGALKVSAPASNDTIAYLLLRSLQAASESGQADRIMQPVSAAAPDAGYRLFDVAPGVRLGAKVSIVERSTPLTCAGARTSTAALFVGCWLTGAAFESTGQSWLSAESQPKIKQWLSTLSPESITQLKAMPAGPTFKAVTFDVGPLAVVFPSLLSPLLGNKRSVYVNNSQPPTIVNFFSADFADEIFLSAYEQTLKNEGK